MSEYYRIKLNELDKRLRQHIGRKQTQFKRAVVKAARKGGREILRRSPRAFGELRESIHVTKEPTIIVDAPHAAAVEVGSRPHYVPLEDLIKWVKLRLYQATVAHKFGSGYKGFLTKPHRVGTTTMRQMATVHANVMSAQATGMSEDEAVVEVAKAIQSKIAEVGTAPHKYVEKSLPSLWDILDVCMKEAANQKVGK